RAQESETRQGAYHRGIVLIAVSVGDQRELQILGDCQRRCGQDCSEGVARTAAEEYSVQRRYSHQKVKRGRDYEQSRKGHNPPKCCFEPSRSAGQGQFTKSNQNW